MPSTVIATYELKRLKHPREMTAQERLDYFVDNIRFVGSTAVLKQDGRVFRGVYGERLAMFDEWCEFLDQLEPQT